MKATLVLLPLLGANNILAITGPFSTSPVHYGLWSFVSFALTAFQGLLFSLLYCFSNSDVRIYDRHVASAQQNAAAAAAAGGSTSRRTDRPTAFAPRPRALYCGHARALLPAVATTPRGLALAPPGQAAADDVTVVTSTAAAARNIFFVALTGAHMNIHARRAWPAIWDPSRVRHLATAWSC